MKERQGLTPRETGLTSASSVILLLGGAYTAMATVLMRGPGAYAASHWYFDYTDGVVARAAVGTVLRLLGGDPTSDVRAASAAIFVATAALLVVGAAVAAAGRSATVAVVALATLSQVIAHLSVQAGRFDGILAILAVAAAVVIRSRLPGRVWFASGLMVVSVAVHEAALLLTVIWMAAYAFHDEVRRGGQPGQSVIAGLQILLPAALVAAAIATYTPAVELAVLADRLFPPTIPPLIEETAVSVHYNGLVDNIRETADIVSELGLLLYFLYGTLLPVAMVGYVIVRAFRESAIGWRDVTFDERLLVITALAPLGLLPVAHDWNRWFTATNLLLGAACVLVLRRRAVPSPSPRLIAEASIAALLSFAIPLSLQR